MKDITDLDLYRQQRDEKSHAVLNDPNTFAELPASELPDLSRIAHELAASAAEYREYPRTYDTARMEDFVEPESDVPQSIGIRAVVDTPENTNPNTPEYVNTPQQYVLGLGERISQLRELRKAA